MSASALPRSRRPWSVPRLLQDERGAAAVEFAIVSGALLMTIVFVMFVGLLLYMGQALDRATSLAARQIMTGVVQGQAISSASAFATSFVCPALPATFTCSKVIVNAQKVSASDPAYYPSQSWYYTLVNSSQTSLIVPTLSNSSTQFNPGVQKDYVYLQVIYPITFLPSFMANLLSGGATYNGSPAYLAISTAAFRNEQY